MNPVEAYFTELRDIRGSGGGVAETSYYGALASLLTEVGRGLKPKVRAVSQLRNLGAGAPDFGLFTQPQFAHRHDDEPLTAQPPARGVVEVKGTSDEVFDRSRWPDPQQVERYVERYGLVLVTNLRDFVLVGRDSLTGAVTELESCRLAHGEVQFWSRCATPRSFAEEAGEGLTEFLRRVLLAAAPLSDPKDVAWFLASYARTARLRLEQQRELPALALLRSQLEEALGLEFAGEKGDHFFRSTLVQTLFYGVFAAWVLWSRQRAADNGRGDRFEWELASRTLDVPFISALFYQFADPRKLGELRIDEVLNWAEEVLARVDREVFFERFREEHAVQYFYEPFLEAFDPQLRKELGVWYTPDEVVRYMVAKVDVVLRDELGLANGLADESVWVLDPCCGTGAYLVEVLRQIDRTLQAKGADALTRQDVKLAAMKRIIGFEIMPAPFVIAHLQLGLLLAELGVPLSHVHGEHERAAVYLTNALTGWRSQDAISAAAAGDKRVHPAQLLFEFEEERDAAAKVKREAPILVVLGNPPYNIYAGMAVDEERELSDAYRATVRVAKPQGRGLNDLFVRFFRLAERQIAEHSGRGVVCLVTNNAWLDGLSFTGMRERYLGTFDRIWIDNLNGDKYRTGKLTPSGEPDPSVFSTEKNREGIQVGTAVTTLVRLAPARGEAEVRYRDFWGAGKRRQLEDAARRADLPYDDISPLLELGLALLPQSVSAEYVTWPKLPELMPFFTAGVITSRDRAVVAMDHDGLEARIRDYLASDADVSVLARDWPELFRTDQWFDPVAVRNRLVQRGLEPTDIVPYQYRPFDRRWLFWEKTVGLVRRPRPELVTAMVSRPLFLLSQQKPRRQWSPPQVCEALPCFDVIDRGASCFPVAGSPAGVEDGLLAAEEQTEANLGAAARAYFETLGLEPSAETLLHHVVAIGHAPAYGRENADALMQDWMRIPLAAAADVLARSAALGGRVCNLLAGCGSAQEGRMRLGVLSIVGGEPLDASRDLAVSAHWGIAGRGGIAMPSGGRLVERDYAADEMATLSEGAEAAGLSLEASLGLLGATCLDVYLNDRAFWRCVPIRVWRYGLGGYSVIKKWLSYRERALLGRDLRSDEARHVTDMACRIAAILLLEPALDENYERVKADTYVWPEGGGQ